MKKHAAQLLIQAGRHEEGILHLEEILEKESDPDTVCLLAQAWYDQGQFRKAQACLQRITGETTAQMLMLAAKIALALEDPQEAADRYEEALERELLSGRSGVSGRIAAAGRQDEGPDESAGVPKRPL